MKRLLIKLLGGRPMHLLRAHYFTDEVSGETVGLYRDQLGRRWMATNRWGWFRVETN
jgi:hypothetical protein